MRDGGYRRAEFWLSDGWSTINQEGWTRPFYWTPALDAEFTLRGLQPLDEHAPVCHLSYYEADAFARWAKARLPTEAEWELAAESLPVRGNLLRTDALRPLPAGDQPGMKQMFGDVWEWTASPYVAYPGYRPRGGRARRIQRQVHVQSAGPARRLVRHAGGSRARHVSKFLLSAGSLAIHGRAPGARPVEPCFS